MLGYNFNETLCSLLVLYGLEVIDPTGKVLSLPTTVADPAI